MSRHDVLVAKLLSNPKDFTYSELKTLLRHWGYEESNKGRSSGSRVCFYNPQTEAVIFLHKPHPQKELKQYQIREIIRHLREKGLI